MFEMQQFSFNTLICTFLSRVNGEEVRLMLWDTAGQEEFDAITKAYYRGKYVANAITKAYYRGKYVANAITYYRGKYPPRHITWYIDK
jgi:hypothetical protein